MKDAAQSSTSLWNESIKSTIPAFNLAHYSSILGFQHSLHTCRDQTSSQLPEGEEHSHDFLPRVRLLAQSLLQHPEASEGHDPERALKTGFSLLSGNDGSM